MEASIQRPSVYLLSRNEYWVSKTQPFLQSSGINATRIELPEVLALPERKPIRKLIMRIHDSDDNLLDSLRLITSKALVLVIASREVVPVHFRASISGADFTILDSLDSNQKMVEWVRNPENLLREEHRRQQQRGYFD